MPQPDGRNLHVITVMNKTHTIFHVLTDRQTLKWAARRSMRRCSAPGADGVTWKRYRANLEANLEILRRRLLDGTWKPGPVRLEQLVEFTGKRFEVAIPTVEDRIVQRALRRCLESSLEMYAFADFVSGWRPGRNRLTSLRQGAVYREQQRLFVADVDVADVSNGVSVDEVIDWLAVWIADGSILRVVRTALSGLPSPIARGSGLSPMLINLRLAFVDTQLSDLPVVRFGDNYCAFFPSLAEACRGFERIVGALASRGLLPAMYKSQIRTRWNVEDLFLIGG